MNLQKRLDYLIEYPHGCIEQTTSAVFPQLVLNQLTDLDDYKKAQVDKNVKAGITRARDQNENRAHSRSYARTRNSETDTQPGARIFLEGKRERINLTDFCLRKLKSLESKIEAI